MAMGISVVMVVTGTPTSELAGERTLDDLRERGMDVDRLLAVPYRPRTGFHGDDLLDERRGIGVM